MKKDRVIERQKMGCNWVLCRTAGKRNGTYFYIADISGSHDCSVMLFLFTVSRNYFKCRSLAIRMYDAFVAGLPKR